MKSIDKKFKPRSVLPSALGAGLILAVASPVLAGAPTNQGLNPSAKNPILAQTQANVLLMASMKNPCNPCNPCAAKNPCAAHNPCAANPCAAKNPCAASNPCAANPCAATNPCMAGAIDTSQFTRPAGTKLASGNKVALIAEGKDLFMSAKIGTNGMSCNSCHNDNNSFENTFAQPYPHRVAMTFDRAGLSTIALDEMIQFCIITPLQGKALPWDSRELAALTAYTSDLQKSFVPEMDENPCAAKNPCAAQNPCAAKNPCAAQNPCAAKNPCAANNPCAAH